MWHLKETGEVFKRFWVVKPKGQRPLGRPRCRWEDKIKMDHQEVAWGHALH